MKNRFSCRNFSDEKIDDEVINEILALTMLSPSSLGLEPWKFVVVSKKDDLKNLGEICFNQSQVSNCSHAVVVMARTDLQSKDEFLKEVIYNKNQADTADAFFERVATRTDAMNKKELFQYASLQCYLAVANLVNIAYEKDVKSCIIGGFDSEKLDKFVGLGDDIKPCLVIALGKSDEAAPEKIRMSFDKTVMWK
ncbi:MAG: NAD(P)H-dependent oxidoreductase [Campylobacteraceae bacterium]|nr:NAD(P)H-dependent oxidoreductase [Campylobacteraceae bacterium]